MKRLKIIVSLLLALSISPALRAAEGGEIIWWAMESDTIQLDGKVANVSELQVIVPGGETLRVNGARVRYNNADGSFVGYLDIYAFDGANDYFQLPDAVAPVPGAYFSTLGGNANSYTYALELGNWSNGNWLTGMVSESATYAELLDKQHIAKWDGVTPNYSQPWTPAAYSVPEPSGGLLLLLGGAGLLLRRRRRNGGA